MRGRAPHLLLAVGIVAICAVPAAAQKKYDSGASDTEIKVGNIAPYSGPLFLLWIAWPHHRGLFQQGQR